MTFGPNLISRDKKTGGIASQPYVYSNDERATELAAQIIHRVNEKAGKNYPPGTILVVNCVETGLVLEDEWEKAIQIVKAEQLQFPFRKAFLAAPIGRPSATLYSS